MQNKKALVVLSGGQDSTTCLFWAQRQYGRDNVAAITFNYGQRHIVEISAAIKIAKMAKCSDHEIIEVDDILASTSPLLSTTPLPEYTDYASMLDYVGDEVEDTFVPMRNAFFLTIAANRAIEKGYTAVVIGINEADTANYPDCTEAFLSLFTSMTYAATLQKVDFVAPLMHRSKAQTVLLARELGADCWKALAYTHTSYNGEYPPVNMNHANILRAKGFEDAGLPDPLVCRAINAGLMQAPMTANYDQFRGNGENSNAI